MLTLFSFPFKAMGSRCQIHAYLSSQNESNKLFERVHAEVRRLEDKYTRYKSSSITSKINVRAGSNRFFEVDDEACSLLNYADALYRQSEGLFDITSGVLRRVWDFKSNTLPDSKSLSDVLSLVGWDRVHWSENKIYLPEQGMEIDFGGFVKEYTADVVATLCLDFGVQHGLVNLGGDVKVVGPHPDGAPWRVGIQHPRKPGHPIATVEMADGAVATSGDYERYMLVDGIRYCHILNPLTGMSIKPAHASVSVIAESCLVAGSFSTLAMLNSSESDPWLHDLGLPYLYVDQSMNTDGTLLRSCV